MTSTYQWVPYVGDIPPVRFPQRLKIALEYAGCSQSQLADRLGMAPRSVQNWARGTSRPFPPIISQIAQVLEVDEAWLLGSDPGKRRLRGRDSNPQPSGYATARTLAHAA
ncbi:MAG: helix-turn-helix domain-containing protein [Acidimicrobiales bacterium]